MFQILIFCFVGAGNSQPFKSAYMSSRVYFLSLFQMILSLRTCAKFALICKCALKNVVVLRV